MNMATEPVLIGRILSARTDGFTIGCSQPIGSQGHAMPEFGALIKATGSTDVTIYGLVANVSIEDDAFVRQIVAAGIEEKGFAEEIEDLRQQRQVPIIIEVVVIGHAQGTEVYQRLPPRPPLTLSQAYACDAAELAGFTDRHDWLRLALAALKPPADQLVAAALRAAAGARPPAHRDAYLLAAGRELARLLAMDVQRLSGILAQLH